MKFKRLLNESRRLNESKFDDVLSKFLNGIATKLGKNTLEDLVDVLKDIKRKYGDNPDKESYEEIFEVIKDTILGHKEIDRNEVIAEGYINEDFNDIVKKLKDYCEGGIIMGTVGAFIGGSLGWKIGYGSMGYSLKVVADGVASALMTGIGYIGIGAVVGILIGVIGGIAMVYAAKKKREERQF